MSRFVVHSLGVPPLHLPEHLRAQEMADLLAMVQQMMDTQGSPLRGAQLPGSPLDRVDQFPTLAGLLTPQPASPHSGMTPLAELMSKMSIADSPVRYCE